MRTLDEINSEIDALLLKMQDADQEDLDAINAIREEVDKLEIELEAADQPPAIEEAPDTEIPELIDPDDVDPDDVAPDLGIDDGEDGPVISLVPPAPYLFKMVPLYHDRDTWAEESGALKANSAQMSFGNGATGNIGLPFGNGWEITTVYANADTANVRGSFVIDIVDMRSSASTKDVIASIKMSGGGQGDAKSGHVYEELAEPAKVPDGAVLGFLTREVEGTYSDVRVGFLSRLKYAEAVAVTANPDA